MKNNSPEILIVEDDADIRDLLKIVLEADGYHVDVAGDGRDAIDQATMSADEYAVYGAVIDDIFADNKATSDVGNRLRVKLLAIEEHTVVYPPQGLSPDQNPRNLIAPSLHPEAFADYRTRNKQPATLTRSFNIKIEYVLVGSPESKRAVYEAQGGQLDYLTLSRIGFNNAHTEALVYVGYSCGGLCGVGFGLFLLKESGVWHVNKKSVLYEI